MSAMAYSLTCELPPASLFLSWLRHANFDIGRWTLEIDAVAYGNLPLCKLEMKKLAVMSFVML